RNLAFVLTLFVHGYIYLSYKQRGLWYLPVKVILVINERRNQLVFFMIELEWELWEKLDN
ncbi:MAG: hypothetical protein ABIA21_00390, partial [Candidatus Aenigmatarchaeota archaeon]